jgi:hypothetical protein
MTRCIDTGHDVATGLGTNSTLVINQAIFDPVAAGVCADLTSGQYVAAINAQLNLAQQPSSYLYPLWQDAPSLLLELQSLVGSGVAPAMVTIPNIVSPNGYYTGGMYVASEGFVETFVLEAGSGMPVAWGLLDGAQRSELYGKLLQLHVLYAKLNHGNALIGTRQGGPALWYSMQRLLEPSFGAEVLVGHDTTLDAFASLLGLQWQCGGFAANAAEPLAGLLFARNSDRITIEAVCAVFEGSSAGEALLGKVTLGGVDVSVSGIPLMSLVAQVQAAIDWACISK